MNTNALIVKYPPQYGVITTKLEKKDNDFNDSLFPSVYNGCEKSVKQIIQHNKEIKNEEVLDIEPFVNPIIAITGSRGSGKSSAMYSFAQYLKNANIDNATFSILPPIDATQFGPNESVIGNITAAMYREYCKNNEKLSVDEKRNYVATAKEVNNTAVMYATGEWFECGDDLLHDAEKVGSLRKRLHDLISLYLRLYSKNKFTYQSDENRYLVIMLDDLDMCNDGAFSIIEEIRKFLCIRNVIILMTMQSTQLRTVLQASFSKAFKYVDQETTPQIRNISFDLAFRSFEKLFPASRCHAMPVWNSEQLKKYELHILNEGKDIYGEDIKAPTDVLFKNITKKQERSKILYRTLHMIWRKTLLIPVCNKDGEHLLLPNNLRSLHNFIAMLSGMEDAIRMDNINDENIPTFVPGLQNFNNFIQEGRIDNQILEKNLSVFEAYLLDNLSTYGDSLNNNTHNQELANTLLNIIVEINTIPLEKLNAKIVGDILDSKLPEYVQSALGKTIIEKNNKIIKGEIAILQDAVSYADSISIGDVMYVLGKIDVKTRCRYITYLIEIIRTMWSIRMTKEFYTNCTHSQDKLTVSETFRNSIGGLIVDGNTTTFTGRPTENDWYAHRSNLSEYDDLFFTTAIDLQHNFSSISKPINLAKKCLYYRKPNLVGDRYYTNDSSGIGPKYVICHPLAYYTNALDRLNKHHIYFPFYSLDFMYRFYEEFRKCCRNTSFTSTENLDQDFALLDANKINAMEAVLLSISYYIPLKKESHYNQYNANQIILEQVLSTYTNSIESIKALASYEQIEEYLEISEFCNGIFEKNRDNTFNIKFGMSLEDYTNYLYELIIHLRELIKAIQNHELIKAELNKASIDCDALSKEKESADVWEKENELIQAKSNKKNKMQMLRKKQKIVENLKNEIIKKHQSFFSTKSSFKRGNIL